MRKVLITTIVLLVAYLSIGFANPKDDPTKHKIGEDENLIVYLDRDSLNTNLKVSYGKIPDTFTAKYWLYFQSKSYPNTEVKVYEELTYDVKTGVGQSKDMLQCFYENGKLVETNEEGNKWATTSIGEKIFKFAVLEWDLERYMADVKDYKSVIINDGKGNMKINLH